MFSAEDRLFGQCQPIELSTYERPKLIVVVDTESEFDWNADPDPQALAVDSMRSIGRAQSICDKFGIKPCYVVDYAVASQTLGYEPLVDYLEDGRCEIGAHLHPWVTPPIEESLCARYSFPGNLPAYLERQKILNLTRKIKSVFGISPKSFKSGRYGFGPNTARFLEEFGYQVDLSVCPPIDYSYCEGPDYSHFDAKPFWFGSQNQLLEVPITGAFCGSAGSNLKALYALGQRYPKLKLQSLFSRLGLVDRLVLSPEGFCTNEHIKLTKALYALGVRTFTWSFHSTSLAVGNTPYVRNQADLDELLSSFTRYFEFFFGELGGVASSPLTLRSEFKKEKRLRAQSKELNPNVG